MLNNLRSQPRNVTFLLIFVSAIILLPSFLLLMASSWNSDDYFVAKLYQVQGLNGFSEIILYLYYNAVSWLGKPFTGGIILIFWLLLLSSIFIFIKDTIKKNSLFLQNQEGNNLASTNIKNKEINLYLQIWFPLVITLIFFIYLLYSQRPNAMFYVVVVSVAYVSTLAGIIFNLNFFINQSNSHTIAKTNLLLLIIFIGCFFVLK